MGLSSRQRSPVSDEQLIELFDQGTTHADSDRWPPYTERSDGEVSLRPASLRDPAVFIHALRDFVRSNALACQQRNEDELPFSDDEWQRHLRQTVATLHRAVVNYGAVLTPNTVRDLAIGQAAEFAVMHWTRTMIERFAADDETHLSIPEWTGDESAIPLGDDYYLKPFFGTNYVLFRERNRETVNVGEHDGMVLVGNDVALLIDVSTSHAAVRRKLARGDSPEALFLSFRESMQQLFRNSEPPAGFENVAKIHVVCDWNRESAMSVLARHQSQDAVFKLQLPVYATVDAVSRSIVKDLEDSGALTFGRNRTFSLRPRRS